MRLPPLVGGSLLRRYKRFLADVELDDGRRVTAHCPNTGSMESCWYPGARCQVSHSANPARKLPWTLERVDTGGGWIGINTSRANAIVAEGIDTGRIAPLAGWTVVAREPRFEVPGHPRARFDLRITRGDAATGFVEVKNATLLRGTHIAFPDAVTARGRKHLELLRVARAMGHEAWLVFALNRPESDRFRIAAEIDPGYAEAIMAAADDGVRIVCARIVHSSRGARVTRGWQWQPSISVSVSRETPATR